MILLLTFSFCLITAGTDAVTTVTGYRGSSVQIQCSYTSGYEDYKKYLCRGGCSSWQDVSVDSESPAKDTRFSLHDDAIAKGFTVTITDLRPEDGGTYWCGVERTGQDIYTETLLMVVMDDSAISTISPSTHTTHSASAHIVSPSVRAESFTTGSETVTQSPIETNRDDENNHNLLPLQAKEKANLPESVYQSLDPTTNQSDSVYQGLTCTNNQSD